MIELVAKSILDETRNGQAVSQPRPVFDWDQFAEIEAAIGAANARLLLTLLFEEASTRPAIITRLALANSTLALVTEAHAMRGAAGNVGATWLAEAARSLETAIAQGMLIAPAIEEIRLASLATIDEISTRL